MFLFLQSKKIQSQLKELRYGKKDLLFKVSIFLPTFSNWLVQYLNYNTIYLKFNFQVFTGIRVIFDWIEGAFILLPT